MYYISSLPQMPKIKKPNYLSSLLKNKGAFVLKKILNENEKKKIINAFFSTLRKYIKIDNRFDDSNVENILLHKKLIKFRKQEPQKFGNFYDELSLNASLRSIFYSKKFIKLFSKILNTKEEFLYLNGFMFRLDAPHDKRNVLDWHQDSPWFQQSYPSFNAAVCWIPVTDHNYKNGATLYVPKSHGKYINVKREAKGRLDSLQFRCSPTKDEKKLIQRFEPPFGDIVIAHFNLKHRSGKNISKKFRLTLGCRYHDTSKDFNIGKERYFFNKTKSIYLIKN
tara:strand:+ start:611 stop:1450 length:840 start_codon:yes stop_codon:yes gene_type:complete